MITDRDYLRAERDYLTPPDTLRDDHAQCVRCRCMSSDLDDDGACPGCVETTAEMDALAALNAITERWVRVNGRPTREHVAAVSRARAEATLSTRVIVTGWVAL